MIAKLLNRRPASSPPAPAAQAYGPPPGARPDPFYRDERRGDTAEAATWIPRRPWFSRRPPQDADRR